MGNITTDCESAKAFPDAKLHGIYNFINRTEKTIRFERPDGQVLVFVDSGRTDTRRRTRWYVADDRNRCIGSLWQDRPQSPEFDDWEYRYGVFPVEQGSIEQIFVKALRKKGRRKAKKDRPPQRPISRKKGERRGDQDV